MTPTADRRSKRKKSLRQAGTLLVGGALLATAVMMSGSVFVAVCIFVVGLIGAASLAHKPGGVPILVYHSVSPDASWLPWSANTSVRPETLRTHLKTLKVKGWHFISTAQLVDARRAGKPLPRKSVILHFDDAYLDNFLFAAPILREFCAPAMFFASTDFVASGLEIREVSSQEWQGYMNVAELRALDADPLFDVEAHGTNHARIPISDRKIGVVTAENWKKHAPLSWMLKGGDKSDWFRELMPPAPLQIAGPILENDSALAGRWYTDDRLETEADYAKRVHAMLSDAYRGLHSILGRAPTVMAWPFDRCCPVSIQAAQEAGFAVVTGGRGENRADEDPSILSRVHVQDFAFGGGGRWLEALALRARVNAAAGRYVWQIVSAIATRLRRRRFGASGYGPVS